MKEPKREDFGWEMPAPALGEEGGWTVEGGEEAYEEAVKAYQLFCAWDKTSTIAHFSVDFDGIRQNVLTAYNDLVKLLKLGATPLNDVTVDGYELGDAINDLRASVIMLCGLMTNDQPSLIDREAFSIEDFDIESIDELSAT